MTISDLFSLETAAVLLATFGALAAIAYGWAYFLFRQKPTDNE